MQKNFTYWLVLLHTQTKSSTSCHRHPNFSTCFRLPTHIKVRAVVLLHYVMPVLVPHDRSSTSQYSLHTLARPTEAEVCVQATLNLTKGAQVAQKLHSTAKIALLRKNIKTAQKLRCARSQFSDGTSYVTVTTVQHTYTINCQFSC